MKKSILCLLIVLALCLCLCTMLVACGEDPVTNEPPAEENPAPEAPETPEEETPEEETPEVESDKKGQLHPTPGADSADTNINEPNEQLPDSTLRG